MAKTTGKRAREEAETYDSDGGFVSNDDGGAPKKKTKKGQATSKPKGEDGDEKFWELSSGRNPRRVAISEFKNAKLINIREFYEKDDEMLPGKKGISLNIDQYQALLKAIPQINAELKEMGVELSGDSKDEDDEEEDVAMDEEPKPKKKVKARKESKPKANIEATSDEDEE